MPPDQTSAKRTSWVDHEGVDPSRVAVCHEWLTTYGGSEQVAQRLAQTLDAKRVFTFTARPRLARELFGATPVTVIEGPGHSKWAQEHWQWFLPFMGRAWQKVDLEGFDAVVTSSHSCVNSIQVPPGVPHISYVHTPMRYAWDWRAERDRLPLAARPAWPLLAAALRRGDIRRARNVDVFIANSRNVAARIERYYGRGSHVVHPPVDIDFWTPAPGSTRESFLVAGRLVAYKRADVAVRAARDAGVDLIVAGAGPELKRLQQIAGPRTRFVGSPSRETLRELYRTARALVFPGTEDFGMVMVEAQACGTPVVALNEGGAKEAVIPGVTGILYETDASLSEQLHGFDDGAFDRAALRAHAERFNIPRFSGEIRMIVKAALDGSQ